MRLTQRRQLSALIALTYLVGYLLAFAHFVLEEHVECLEHHTQHHVARTTADARPLSAVPGVTSLPAEGDDHCHIFEIVRTQSSSVAAPAATALVPQAVPTPMTTAFAVVASEHVGRQIWRFAPKQSPPVSV